MPTREDAWTLFCEWTQSDSLRKHVLGVEAAMRAYARRFGEDEELWAVTGIVHDLDYERYPDLETGHPRHAIEELRRLGYPDGVVDAVAGHATFLNVPRETTMAKTLFAVDELSGFIAACALVRPTGIHGMTPKSVKKKLKQPSFAAAVSRDEVREGADELGVDFDEHLATVIAAMEERATELGLDGSSDAASAATQ
ncbi:MAG: HDIG domain-containing protein [Actinobacteria bacterium]|nr:MAG: HDIG domain-containing protein [Actinomycetota bacterium]